MVRALASLLIVCWSLPWQVSRISTTGAAAADSCVSPRQVTALASGPQGSLLIGTATGTLYRLSAGRHCAVVVATLPGRIAIGTLLTPPGHPSWLIAGGSLLVTTQIPTTLYHSTNGGTTWTRGTAGLPAASILPVQMAATASSTLVLSYDCASDLRLVPVGPGEQSCPQGLARSEDGGTSWHSVGPRQAQGRGVIAVHDGSLLAIESMPVGKTSTRQLDSYRSRDDGRTWTFAGRLPGNASDIATLVAVPSTVQSGERVCAGFGIALLSPTISCSTDGGAHWSLLWRRANNVLGIDMAVVAFASVPRRHALLLSDLGAVYRSVDNGATWAKAVAGLPAPNDRVWALLIGGDGITVYAGTAYAGLSAAGLYASRDGGVTWTAD